MKDPTPVNRQANSGNIESSTPTQGPEPGMVSLGTTGTEGSEKSNPLMRKARGANPIVND